MLIVELLIHDIFPDYHIPWFPVPLLMIAATVKPWDQSSPSYGLVLAIQNNIACNELERIAFQNSHNSNFNKILLDSLCLFVYWIADLIAFSAPSPCILALTLKPQLRTSKKEPLQSHGPVRVANRIAEISCNRCGNSKLIKGQTFLWVPISLIKPSSCHQSKISRFFALLAVAKKVT